MNNGKKSRKLLFVATTLMIIALASVLTVYAAFTFTIAGTAVTVTDVGTGTVYYSTDGTTYDTSSSGFNVGGNWFARILTSTTYTKSVTITWQLQKDNGSGTFIDVSGKTATTTVTLTGPGQIIYASDDGASTGNHNWGNDITTGGSYKITATFNSAP